MSFNIDKISDLIAKYATHSLPETEKQELDQWLDDSYNKLQFEKILASYQHEALSYKKVNTQKAWRKIKRSKSQQRNASEKDAKQHAINTHDPYYIFALISKSISTGLSPLEKSYLHVWLQDPCNKMQYDQIVSQALQESDYFSTKPGQHKFTRSISPKKAYRTWLAYAATILLPIAIGLIIVLSNKQEALYNAPVADSWKIVPGKVMLKMDNGEEYVFTYQDTILATSLGNIHVDSNQISYKEKAQLPDSLIQFQTIAIPRGTRYQLQLADGSKVWLNALSRFRYPIKFKGDKREVYLLEGEAYFEVSKNKNMPFIVNVDDEQVKVLGTQFNIKAYKEENVKRITLVEGSVLVSNQENRATMKANQQIEIKSTGNDLIMKDVDAELYTAWKDGKFRYRNASLQQILMDMERQYNLKIFYEDSELKQEIFSISVNFSEDFTEILDLLQTTESVQFEVKDKLLIIKR